MHFTPRQVCQIELTRIQLREFGSVREKFLARQRFRCSPIGYAINRDDVEAIGFTATPLNPPLLGLFTVFLSPEMLNDIKRVGTGIMKFDPQFTT